MGGQRALSTVVIVIAATVAMNALAQSTLPGRGQSPPSLVLDSIAGRDSFEFYCASCHGTGGKGDGPIASALKATPARIENIVAYVATLQEPAAGADELGARLFKTHCATCHGLNGRGDGPLAGQLRRLPPDLTRFSARNGDVFPSERLRRIIDGQDVPSHGDREMPVWGDVFRDSRDGATSDSAKARIDAIVKYLQSLQQRAALPGN